MGICKNDGVDYRNTTQVPGKVQFELVNSKSVPRRIDLVTFGCSLAGLCCALSVASQFPPA